jgi:hypothetical protein
MGQKPNRTGPPPAAPVGDPELAPITAMMSSRLMVLANLLKRGAISDWPDFPRWNLASSPHWDGGRR